jgi:hypothetical protein
MKKEAYPSYENWFFGKVSGIGQVYFFGFAQ